MVKRVWGVAILAGLLVAQTAPTWADDASFPGRNVAPLQPSAGPPVGAWQNPASLPAQAAGGWGGGAPQASFAQPPQGQGAPAPVGFQPAMSAFPPQSATPPGNGILRLPATGSAAPGGGIIGGTSGGAGQGVDGTWREDGQYVIINVNGKETKLLKPGTQPIPCAADRPRPAEGTVRGRLMQNGRPLANCNVVIVPMEAERRAYGFDPSLEPLTATTDPEGVYYFEHVPAGKYKLTWLPERTNQWIRRIDIKPDFVVHAGQEVYVKTIGAALRTIN
jgi:hypothetical protein